MRIKDLMTRKVETCTPDTTLAEAGWKMWERDCGVLPILSDGKVVGMVTDRDIAIAAATKAHSAREIAVREVMNRKVHACDPEEDLSAALDIMAQEQVRRVPVVDSLDQLQGVLSLNDLILRAESTRGNAGTSLSFEDVMETLKEVSKHRKEPQTGTGRREELPGRGISAKETPAGRRQ